MSGGGVEGGALLKLHALHDLVDVGVKKRVGARVKVALGAKNQSEPPVRFVIALHAHRHEWLLNGVCVLGLLATVWTRLLEQNISIL